MDEHRRRRCGVTAWQVDPGQTLAVARRIAAVPQTVPPNGWRYPFITILQGRHPGSLDLAERPTIFDGYHQDHLKWIWGGYSEPDGEPDRRR